MKYQYAPETVLTGGSSIRYIIGLQLKILDRKYTLPVITRRENPEHQTVRTFRLGIKSGREEYRRERYQYAIHERRRTNPVSHGPNPDEHGKVLSVLIALIGLWMVLEALLFDLITADPSLTIPFTSCMSAKTGRPNVKMSVRRG